MGYFDKLDKELRGILRIVADVSCKTGSPAYLVGGAVRDLLLGRTNLDLDIVIEGDAIAFAGECVGELRPRKIVAHKRFGTASVRLKSGQKIDFATARKEIYPDPASLPVVTPGALNDDLQRRDFTINAMALSLSCEGKPRVIDRFGGLADLRSKKIRVLHDLSFIDDPTRILRAVRFEQRYRFEIEPHTLFLLKRSVSQGMLLKTSPHRLRDELILIMKEDEPVRAIKRACALGGFGFITKGMAINKETNSFLKSVGRQAGWFKKIHCLRRPLDTWIMFLTAALDPLPGPRVKKVCASLGLRKGDEKRIMDFKGVRRGFIKNISARGIAASRLFALLEPLSYEVMLLIKAKYTDPSFQKNIEKFLKACNGVKIRTNGEDLKRLGVPPGPEYQEILGKVLEATLDGNIKTRQQELKFIKSLIGGNI